MKKHILNNVIISLFILFSILVNGCGPSKIKSTSNSVKPLENKKETIKSLKIIPQNVHEFDIYENKKRICSIEDKGVIDNIITEINRGKFQSIDANDVLKDGRTYKSVLTTEDGHKIDIYILNNDLEEKGMVVVKNKVVAVKHDITRYLDSIKNLKNIDLDVKSDVFNLFNKYGWSVDFRINTIGVKLPQSFSHSAGEFPVKIYWVYNNELSKSIGLNFEKCLGKTVSAEIYRLREPLPEFLRPRKEARGIVIRYEGTIVGAYIDAGRHESFACSLESKSLEQITGKTFDELMANFINYDDKTEIKLSKMQPEEVIKEYYNAINRHDKNMLFSCLTRKNLSSYLSSNMDNRKLYNESDKDGAYDGYDNIKSVKLINMKKVENKGNPENVLEYEVEADYKYIKPITSESGVQPSFIMLKKENEKGGWKIQGVGTGL